MKKEVKKNRRKNVKWMAAAVLTATLLSSQVMPSVAAGSDTEISVSTIIPENITIEYPVPLSEISLPSSEYGKLSWADDSLVPSRRSEAFEVVFRPSDSFDLSRIEDWDGESEKITGYITVVVSSITQSDEEQWDEEYDTSSGDSQDEMNENGGLEEAQGDELPEEPADPVDTEEDNIEDNNIEDNNIEDNNIEDNNIEENNTEEQSMQEDQTPDSNPEASETPEGDSRTDPENSEEDGEANAEDADPEEADSSDQQTDDQEEGAEPSEENTEADHKQDIEEENKEDSEDITGEDKKEGENQENVTPDDGKTPPAEDGRTQDNGEGTNDQQEEQEDPSETETPAPGETPEGETPDDEPTEDGNPQENPDNIFDRPQEDTEDNRPVTAEDDLTEEEMTLRAQENHSSNGIYVSGINLPWYVQFRATSGESYEFTNESHANIFRSYEFELWDLKNDTEYEIPDGEYISVTIPVKEGYEYTIEHLLDNGATETIIPSVEGSTMIFSTHSFSPFGIAGSKPLVGGEVSENTYLTPTPTPAPTKAPAGSTGNNNTPGNNTGNNNPAGNNNNNNNGTGSTPLIGQNSAGSNSGEPTKDKSGYSTKVTPTPAAADYNSSGSAQTGDGIGNGTGNGASDYTDQADKPAQNTSSVNAVKTGDNTRILPFVILVAAAAVIIAAVLFLKKKKQ